MKHANSFIALMFALAPTVLPAQPKISFDQTEINLGVVYSGMVKAGKFTIKNIGNRPLEIKNVQPSCGCTTAKKPTSRIAPGKTDLIEIKFNSTGMHNKVEKHIMVDSNDPDSPTVNLTLVADVRVELEPMHNSYAALLGSFPLGKETEQQLTFRNVSDHALTIKEVTSSSPGVKARPDKMKLPPSDSLRVTVYITPAKEGYTSEQITIHTDSKNQPNVDMKLYYFVLKQN